MSQYAYQRRPARDDSTIPTIIFIVLVINGLVYAGQQFYPNHLLYFFALWPLSSQPPQAPPFEIWQLLTYGFLHGSPMHIFFNMFGLWMFGRELENLMGPRRFLTYFFTCVVGAAIVQLVVAGMQGGLYPTIGASGGVFGILLAYGLTFPNRTVMLIFPPIPMRAKYFVIFYGLLELYLGVSGNAPGVANFAHLGGMLFGFVLLRYWAMGRRR